MKLKTRTVPIAEITRRPDEFWMMQVRRNLTAADGFLRGIQHVILDRDPLYTTAPIAPPDAWLTALGCQSISRPERWAAALCLSATVIPRGIGMR